MTDEERTFPSDSLLVSGVSKDEVEQFAREVKDLILTSNWTALSERIAYPITMGGIAYEDSASYYNIFWVKARQPAVSFSVSLPKLQ